MLSQTEKRRLAYQEIEQLRAETHARNNELTAARLALQEIADKAVERYDGWCKQIALAALGNKPPQVELPAVTSFPVHADPTGKTREPPHCPTCNCGTPADLIKSGEVGSYTGWIDASEKSGGGE